MSTPLNTTATVPLIRSGSRDAEDHQSGSWSIVEAMRRVWRNWSRRMKERAALADLAENEELLKDVGLSRAQVLFEVDKPFWK